MYNLIPGYSEGANLTIMNAFYRRPTKDPVTGKWEPDYIVIVYKDNDTGKVSVKFTADLDIDNIQYGSQINQLAIVDSSDSTDPNTVHYAAAVFPKFTKNSDIAITFLIEMKI